jgi:ribosome-associated protein
MKKSEIKAQVAIVVRACQEKKAEDITVLQLDEQASGFTDYFIVCSGGNPRQVQAISDEVDHLLSAQGIEPKHIEGYNQADWLLMDYVDFVVHIFSENARKFYDLERLWKSATRIDPAELLKPAAKKAAKRASAVASKAIVAAKAAKPAKKAAPRKRAPAKRKSS